MFFAKMSSYEQGLLSCLKRQSQTANYEDWQSGISAELHTHSVC